jgi:hypothetical protein
VGKEASCFSEGGCAFIVFLVGPFLGSWSLMLLIRENKPTMADVEVLTMPSCALRTNFSHLHIDLAGWSARTLELAVCFTAYGAGNNVRRW